MSDTRHPLPGVTLIEPAVHGDERGFFVESYRLDRYRELGVKERFVQHNHSRSHRNVLRGLHGQRAQPQGKLVRVSRGAVFDVVVDVDPRSATFGCWCGYELSDRNHHQVYVPPGYLHGFLVLSEVADFEYLCTDYYAPGDEIGLIWNDPTVAIEWPVAMPDVSPKDRQWPELDAFRGQG